jgi:hypothetical protein
LVGGKQNMSIRYALAINYSFSINPSAKLMKEKGKKTFQDFSEVST